MIEINYGIAFPFDKIAEDEEVFIVDYHIEPFEMRQLWAMTERIVWIDHHKSAIEKYKDFELDIPGVRVDGTAGCVLTYQWLINGDVPFFTRLIGDYDVWKFEFGDDTRLFQIAFNAYDFSPASKEWDRFFVEDSRHAEHTMIQEGRIMVKFRDGWAKDLMDIGFQTRFEGHLCYALNLARCGSDWFKSLDINGKFGYDIYMPFYFNGSYFSVSMYTDNPVIDVSKIASKYGGGGHKGASGFQCAALPFKKV
jgi:oligoribonuclease NrnB/cAMP/cGMP phosphodiesterase (DHH superfamily)